MGLSSALLNYCSAFLTDTFTSSLSVYRYARSPFHCALQKPSNSSISTKHFRPIIFTSGVLSWRKSITLRRLTPSVTVRRLSPVLLQAKQVYFGCCGLLGSLSHQTSGGIRQTCQVRPRRFFLCLWPCSRVFTLWQIEPVCLFQAPTGIALRLINPRKSLSTIGSESIYPLVNNSVVL